MPNLAAGLTGLSGVSGISEAHQLQLLQQASPDYDHGPAMFGAGANANYRRRVCEFHARPSGCYHGDACKFLHATDAAAAAAATAAYMNGGGVFAGMGSGAGSIGGGGGEFDDFAQQQQLLAAAAEPPVPVAREDKLLFCRILRQQQLEEFAKRATDKAASGGAASHSAAASAASVGSEAGKHAVEAWVLNAEHGDRFGRERLVAASSARPSSSSSRAGFAGMGSASAAVDHKNVRLAVAADGHVECKNSDKNALQIRLSAQAFADEKLYTK